MSHRNTRRVLVVSTAACLLVAAQTPGRVNASAGENCGTDGKMC